MKNYNFYETYEKDNSLKTQIASEKIQKILNLIIEFLPESKQYIENNLDSIIDYSLEQTLLFNNLKNLNKEVFYIVRDYLDEQTLIEKHKDLLKNDKFMKKLLFY